MSGLNANTTKTRKTRKIIPMPQAPLTARELLMFGAIKCMEHHLASDTPQEVRVNVDTLIIQFNTLRRGGLNT